MAPDATRWPQAYTWWQQTFGRLDEKGRDNAVVDDMLGLIDIVNKQVEGLNALLQPTLDEGPIAGFHNAWDDIEREDALRPGRIAVDVERDSHVQEGLLSSSLAPQEFARRQAMNALYQQRCAGTWTAISLKQLVEEAGGVIDSKLHQSTPSLRGEALITVTEGILPLLEAEAHLERHLVLGNFAVLDEPAQFSDFKPSQSAQSFTGTRNRVLGGLGVAFIRYANEL